MLKALAGLNAFTSYSRIWMVLLSMVGFFSMAGFVYGQCVGSTSCTSPGPGFTCSGSVNGQACGQITTGCQSGQAYCGVPGSSSNNGGGINTQQGQAVASEISTICSEIKTVVFVLGLALMILGGALYAGAHVMPGTTKGQIQGYGMGMLVGGIIGVIIALMAPFILKQIISFSSSGVTAPTC